MDVGLIVSYWTLLQVDPSATVTGEGAFYDWKLVKMLVLPVMWFEALQSITHLFEEAIRYVLYDLVKALTEVDSSNNFWYRKNSTNSFAKIKLILSDLWVPWLQ